MLKLDIVHVFRLSVLGCGLSASKCFARIGFGPHFHEWIDFLLYPQVARVMLNGEPGPSVWHRKGLREGETLSAMLFVLVTDALNMLLARAREFGLLLDFVPHDLITIVSFYADEVVIFCILGMGEHCIVHNLLALFGRALGLHTNYAPWRVPRCRPLRLGGLGT